MMWSSLKNYKFIFSILVLTALSLSSSVWATTVNGSVDGAQGNRSSGTSRLPASKTIVGNISSYEVLDRDGNGIPDYLNVIVFVQPDETLIADQIVAQAIPEKNPDLVFDLELGELDAGFGPAITFLGRSSYCFDGSETSLNIDGRSGDEIPVGADEGCPVDIYRIGFELPEGSDFSFPFALDLRIESEEGTSYIYSAIIQTEFPGTQTGNPTGSQLNFPQQEYTANGGGEGARGCSLVSVSENQNAGMLSYLLVLALVLLSFRLIGFNLPNKKGMSR